MSDDPRFGESVRQRDAMTQLVATHGWKMHCEHLKEQEISRVEVMISRPSAGIEGVLAKEYEAGVIAGLRIAASMPDIIATSAKEVINLLTENEEEVQDNG